MTSNSGSQIKGLTQYIADLRQTRVREAEEKRINAEMAKIRTKFRDGHLAGYDKKKYIAKIVFTYILGYPVDIGHMEAINLLSSSKYSEKQIGYLAITLLFNENSDLARLAVNSIRKDLDDMDEVHNCLALHAIANMGGEEMAESLMEDVYRLLISPTSRSFVKKKAALTLLRLYRKHPSIFPVEDWSARIIAMMDHDNLSVSLAVTTLVLAVAQDHPDAFVLSYQKAVNRLAKIVLAGEYTNEFVYYRVPLPWLQVKCLRLLQYYPPSDDDAVKATINEVLEAIVQSSQETSRNIQKNNAQRAILFEAINLAIHIDASSRVVSWAIVLLGKCIQSRETNVRYLGFDTMAHLAACVETLEPINAHQATILQGLKDRDISVRRRALDLLYSMVDNSNSKKIVGELLQYLPSAEWAMREELVLKIAILTEKFASEYEWYVDTILRLLNTAGDNVSDEVWYRVVQIVVNNEDVQAYAAKQCLEYLRAPSAHENIVKVGGYVLGEYGHLIANEPGASPIEQFHIVHMRSHSCTPRTRALLLSTYIKWLNLFPEIREQVLYVLERFRHALDAELQQRACEYYALATRPDDALLQAVCDEIPPFSEKLSLLSNKLEKRHAGGDDKRTWMYGGKDANRDRDAARLQSLARGPANGGAMPRMPSYQEVSQNTYAADEAAPTRHGSLPVDNLLGDLAQVRVNSPGDGDDGAGRASLAERRDSAAPLVSLKPTPTPRMLTPLAPTPTGINPRTSSVVPVTPGFDRLFRRLCFIPEGVLYEDAELQVGLKSDFYAAQGTISLFFGNKVRVPLQSFTVAARTTAPDAIKVSLRRIPPTTIDAQQQLRVDLDVDCKAPFKSANSLNAGDAADGVPTLYVSFLAGTFVEVTVRLPVVLTKFLTPVTLNTTEFFERWRQIGGPPCEAQQIFPLKLTKDETIDTSRNRKIISGANFGLLDGIDPNPINIVAAAVLHTSHAGKVGCLLRFEPNPQVKLARLTVRTTNDVVSEEIKVLLLRNLSTNEASI